MNMNQMEYAIALAEYKKFSEVSKRLYVAQSSISKQICLLEDELGLRLFERLKSGTELTPEGKIIVEAFKCGRSAIAEAVERAKYMQDCGGVLKIGVSDGFESCYVLVRALEALRERHPGLEVSIQSFHYAILANQFNHDQLDMVFNTESELPGRNWESLPLWAGEYSLIVPQDHPLANGTALENYDFSGDVVWLAHHEGSDAYRGLVQGVKELLRVDDSVIRYARNLDSMFACIEAGLGLTVAPWIRRLGNENLYHVPIDNAKLPSLRMMAIWKKKNPNPAVADFVELLRENITETGDEP